MNHELIKEAEMLGRRIARAEMEKTGSLADAILGAPVAAIAARIAAPEESKTKATAYGLILGTLMGWSAGQRAYKKFHSADKDKKPETGALRILEEHPLLAIAAAGGALGGSMRVAKGVKDLGKVLAQMPTNAPGNLVPKQG